jgi:hypothetical protein
MGGSFDRYWTERETLLRHELEKVDSLAARQQLPDAEIADGILGGAADKRGSRRSRDFDEAGLGLTSRNGIFSTLRRRTDSGARNGVLVPNCVSYLYF